MAADVQDAVFLVRIKYMHKTPTVNKVTNGLYLFTEYEAYGCPVDNNVLVVSSK